MAALTELSREPAQVQGQSQFSKNGPSPLVSSRADKASVSCVLCSMPGLCTGLRQGLLSGILSSY